ncbi:glycosyl hydrolase family 3 N terminal domain-containing protein [Apiospora kogelbergensis]|uniref:glycosyl hydrolase family 3 N terminal domain-containing protein n=1 Tax=Apiospora kogelbergensis TaxID=1337665 RepID=UPI0031321F8A
MAALLLSAASGVAGQDKPFVCDGSGAAPYVATKEYLGCFQDPNVSILREAKISTIAMTPQYCANWCGSRGFSFSGMIFGTQCFCGSTPDYSRATNTTDAACSSKCAIEPSLYCGGQYTNSLYQITNPQGEPSDGINSSPNPPACQTNPSAATRCATPRRASQSESRRLSKTSPSKKKILNLIDASAGSERLGLPAHEWWSEATHGVGSAPGVQFPKPPRDFNHATSFPSPILTAASFDDALMRAVGGVVGVEGRAFANHGFSGFNYWAPNMNPFREPRWGRGQETPGEDVLLVRRYVQNYVTGLQGEDPEDKLIIANCKHYAAYDLESGRHGNNYNPSQQDLADYYLSAFKTCVRDTHVGSIMCSYNAVGGMPTCASPYLLQDVLRDHWGFSDKDYHFVVSDCSAVTDVWQWHNFTDTEQGAAAVALNAGTDLECGNSYLKLNESLADGATTEARMDEALTRLYKALFTVGYFDGGAHSALGWANVATAEATALAYRAAVEGMALLKNDGVLPLGSNSGKGYKSIALIGPFANATTQMQGDYSGKAPFLRSPLIAFTSGTRNWTVEYAQGTAISGQNTTGFAEALEAAKKSDLIVYCGGVDNSIENETLDRKNIAWPGNQLELVAELAKLGKPLVVAQFGAGQVDDSALLEDAGVNALLWAGYPSQDGGTALLDILTGKKSPAGRLPITQYPTSYADEVSMFNIDLRPNATANFPGRTYMWYTGNPVLPFGHGLHYTKFNFTWESTLEKSYAIADIVSAAAKDGLMNDISPFVTVTARVANVGKLVSDYVGLLFLSSKNAGPEPRPNKVLVSYDRLHDLEAGGEAGSPLKLPLTLGSLARADENGDLTIFPGDYKLALDNDESLTLEFSLTGEPVVIETLPAPKANYEFTVPVHIQPESTEAMSPS